MSKTQSKPAPVQPVASVTPPAAKPAKVKLVLAMISPDDAKAAGERIAKAVVTCEKAKHALLVSVRDAVSSITVAISAAQFDRQIRPHIAAGFAAAVKRKAIKESTAAQYASRLKTCVLAIVNKLAEPMSGETFWEFYDRASAALPGAAMPDGKPVWEAKAGRPQGSKVSKPADHSAGKADTSSAASVATDEGGTNEAPRARAAMILAGNNSARAKALFLAATQYADQFDKWFATVSAAENTSPRVEPATPAEPATALGAKLVAARARKAANG